jgi:hypothetical protein
MLFIHFHYSTAFHNFLEPNKRFTREINYDIRDFAVIKDIEILLHFKVQAVGYCQQCYIVTSSDQR